MANQVFARNALTGGGAGAIDTIDGSKLADGDLILTADPATRILYAHILDADSGAAEASPVTISPNTNAGNKRHILATLAALGLAFPAAQVASANANTLDDYEEGSWTPGVSFGGGVTGITYSSQAGYYLKIGSYCLFTGRVTLSAKGSSTGASVVTGLPFTSYSAANNLSAVALRINAIAFANAFMGYVNINTTTIPINEITEAGTVTDIAETDFVNTSSIIISGFYRVA